MKTIKRPLPGAGHDAQTVRKVVAGEGVYHDQVTLALGQLQRNLFADGDSLPMLHWTSTDGLDITSPFQSRGGRYGSVQIENAGRRFPYHRRYSIRVFDGKEAQSPIGFG